MQPTFFASLKNVRVRHTFLERVVFEHDADHEWSGGLRRCISDSILVDGSADFVRAAYAAECEAGFDVDDSVSTVSTATPDDGTAEAMIVLKQS
mmetsp:Transcript_47540/g.132173  ORF Transcript_47540/g.132173 Transcript_47540/m.132173 type:complete len:94 (+) Transcript_47540:112-393(+)